MSRSHDIAWAAGFFDGEGYVTINKRLQQKKYIIHSTFVGVNHVAPEPLYEMARLFGGIVVLDQHSLKQSSDGHKRHPRYRWKICSQKAKEALVTMMPYFRNKQKAAEIGIALVNTQNNGPVTDDVLAERDVLWQKLIELNSRD